MGYYVDVDSKGSSIGTTYPEKIESITQDGGIILPSRPKDFQENLVCVVDNGRFAAAGYMNNLAEFLYWENLQDGRPRTWISYPNVKEALRLSGNPVS